MHPLHGAPRARPDESRAHHQLFLTMSGHYEEHCRSSGETESPGVCAAADRFRRERSLASLLAFADRLDELGMTDTGARRKRRT